MAWIVFLRGALLDHPEWVLEETLGGAAASQTRITRINIPPWRATRPASSGKRSRCRADPWPGSNGHAATGEDNPGVYHDPSGAPPVADTVGTATGRSVGLAAGAELFRRTASRAA